MRAARSIAVTFAPRFVASSRARAPVPQPMSRTCLRSGTSATRRRATGPRTSLGAGLGPVSRLKSARMTSAEARIGRATRPYRCLFPASLGEDVFVLAVAQDERSLAGCGPDDQLDP